MHALGSVQPEPVIGPLALVPMVETMLSAAMGRLEAEADAARAETEAVVDGAMRRADALLLAVGTELRTLPAAAIAALDIERPHRPAHLRDAPVVRYPADCPPVPLEVAVEPWAGIAELGLELDLRDTSDTYEYFWREAEVDRPVRERLRRWVQPRPQP